MIVFLIMLCGCDEGVSTVAGNDRSDSDKVTEVRKEPKKEKSKDTDYTSYQGDWFEELGNKTYYEYSLTVSSVKKNDIVFSLNEYRTAGIDDVSVTLDKDGKGKFQSDDGSNTTGTITLKNDVITVEFESTDSDFWGNNNPLFYGVDFYRTDGFTTGKWVQDCFGNVNPEYEPSIVFSSDKTFTFTVNLYSGMGTVNGKYQVSDNEVICTVTSRDFSGYLGDNVNTFEFMIWGDLLIYETYDPIGYTESNAVFMK